MVTDGLSTTESSKPKRDDPAARPSFWRTSAAKASLLLLVFVSFPAIAYQQLKSVDGLWRAPELPLVALAYLILGAVVFGVFLGLVGHLRRFAAAARAVRIGAPAAPVFAEINRVPELAVIVEEFDRMTRSLRLAAEEGRSAADETAHAFKTPIATIAHALMPLRSAVPADNARARRSVELIEQTAARLDALVTASRKMEQARCRVLHPPRWRLDLGSFMRDAVASKQAMIEDSSIHLAVDADSGIYVYGNDDLLEAIIDAVIDNAVAVSLADGGVSVTVRQRDGEAICYIEDDGPGLPTEAIDRAFERFASYQPATQGGADDDGDGKPAQFGIGLWIVRRSVEALGGKVWAENRSLGGLRIVITLPLA